MVARMEVVGIALVLAGSIALSACKEETPRFERENAATSEETTAAESGKEETYGAVDPDEKPSTSGGDWDVSKVENELSASMMAQVFLKNGIKIEPFAFGVKLVGMTETPDSAPPVLLFSGMECTDCDALKGLYVHSVPDKVTTRLDYPGDYHPPAEPRSAPKKRVRFYFGNCLSDSERHLVHHAEEQVGGGRGYARKIRVFSIGADGKVDPKEEKDSFSEESDLLARVKQGGCQELKHERFEKNL